MSAVLAQLRAVTTKQQALLDAVIAAGWVVVNVPFPGAILLGHPDNDRPIPTPDYAREEYAPGRAYYPFPTYHALHQITLLFTPTGRRVPSSTDPTREQVEVKIYSVVAREASCPWVTASDHSLGLGKAIDFVRAPHPSRDVRQSTEEGR